MANFDKNEQDELCYHDQDSAGEVVFPESIMSSDSINKAKGMTQSFDWFMLREKALLLLCRQQRSYLKSKCGDRESASRDTSETFERKGIRVSSENDLPGKDITDETTTQCFQEIERNCNDIEENEKCFDKFILDRCTKKLNGNSDDQQVNRMLHAGGDDNIKESNGRNGNDLVERQDQLYLKHPPSQKAYIDLLKSLSNMNLPDSRDGISILNADFMLSGISESPKGLSSRMEKLADRDASEQKDSYEYFDFPPQNVVKSPTPPRQQSFGCINNSSHELQKVYSAAMFFQCLSLSNYVDDYIPRRKCAKGFKNKNDVDESIGSHAASLSDVQHRCNVPTLLSKKSDYSSLELESSYSLRSSFDSESMSMVRQPCVRFSNPVVTSVNFRPWTTPEEKRLLFFDPMELMLLEADREDRVSGDRIECFVEKEDTYFQVGISVPKVNGNRCTRRLTKLSSVVC